MRKNLRIIQNDEIPDINYFKRAFKKLSNDPGSTYDEIMNTFVTAFGSFPIIPLQFANPEFISDFEAYRVISEKEFLSKSLNKSKVSDFAHPPQGNCSQQRFSTPDFPAFYASSLLHTAIEEKLDPNDGLMDGQIFYMSKWKFKKIIPFTYIMLFYGVDHDNSFQNVNVTLEKNIEYLFRQYSKEKRKALKYFLKNITQFSLVEKFNNVTSALGHYYFYKTEKLNPKIGLIVYPSIKKKKDAYNYALNPKLLAEDVLVCVEVQKLLLNQHRVKESSISLKEIGVVSGENIYWKKFGFRFESAIFYDEMDGQLLKVEGNDLKQNGFNNNEDHSLISIDQFLYRHFEATILKDIMDLAKRNTKHVLKQYNCSISESLVINNSECKKLQFNIKFQYSS